MERVRCGTWQSDSGFGDARTAEILDGRISGSLLSKMLSSTFCQPSSHHRLLGIWHLNPQEQSQASPGSLKAQPFAGFIADPTSPRH